MPKLQNQVGLLSGSKENGAAERKFSGNFVDELRPYARRTKASAASDEHHDDVHSKIYDKAAKCMTNYECLTCGAASGSKRATA